MPYYPHAYSSSAYMPSPGYGYSPYDTGYPVPVHMPMEPYYPPSTTYYPSPYYGHGHRHHRHSRHSYGHPRVFVKHRTIGDRFMGMIGMPQAHLYRL